MSQEKLLSCENCPSLANANLAKLEKSADCDVSKKSNSVDKVYWGSNFTYYSIFRHSYRDGISYMSTNVASVNREARKELNSRHDWEGIQNVDDDEEEVRPYSFDYAANDAKRQRLIEGDPNDKTPFTASLDIDSGTTVRVRVEKVEEYMLQNARPEALRAFLESESSIFRDEVRKAGGNVKPLKGHLLKMAVAVFSNKLDAADIIAREIRLAAEGKTGQESLREQLIIEYAKSSRSKCTLTLEDPKEPYNYFGNKFSKIMKGTLRIGFFTGERTMPGGKTVQFHQWYKSDAFFDRELRTKMAHQRSTKVILESQKPSPDPEVPRDIAKFQGHESLTASDREKIEQLMDNYHKTAPAEIEQVVGRKRHPASLARDD